MRQAVIFFYLFIYLLNLLLYFLVMNLTSRVGLKRVAVISFFSKLITNALEFWSFTPQHGLWTWLLCMVWVCACVVCVRGSERMEYIEWNFQLNCVHVAEMAKSVAHTHTAMQRLPMAESLSDMPLRAEIKVYQWADQNTSVEAFHLTPKEY